MLVEDQIHQLEEEAAQLEQVGRVSERILGELMKSTPPPTRLEDVRGALRSARDLLKHYDQKAAERLVQHAQVTLAGVRQWLAVGDLGISPFVLRTFLEKDPPGPDLHLTLLRYFLTKQPHAENDRDKLDYLLTAYFGAEAGLESDSRWEQPEQLRQAFQQLFAGISPRPVGPAEEMMRHELESLIALLPDFHDFEELVQARMVERVRALKTSLGEAFYDPQLLPTLVRFNLAFRRCFEKLFHQQVRAVREETRQRLEEAWDLFGTIESRYEVLALPEAQRTRAALVPQAGGVAAASLGRPLEVLGERPPIEHLLRRGEAGAQERDNELRGILSRLTRFLEKLPADQGAADKVVFPLRHAKLELVRWEREAFSSAATSTAPDSARTIQQALSLVAWSEEELAQYHQTSSHRYLWKSHFDALSYAVLRVVELFKTIAGLLRPEAPEGEAAWAESLLHTALRLGIALNHLTPVFEEPA